MHANGSICISRCIFRWFEGEKYIRRKWFDVDIRRINALLSKYNETRPKEIHRKIRSLHHLAVWKGSEYRIFLLYIGIVLLKDFLPEADYIHFLMLSCATTICSTDKYRIFLPKARDLFNEYIEQYILVYGIHSISSNVHNLAHIVDDVEYFGCLGTISTYEFENKLHHIKLSIKQCNKPLEQIARRIEESSHNMALKSIAQTPFRPQVLFPFDLTEFGQAFAEIKLKSYKLSSRHSGDRFFLTNEKEIVHFEFAFRHADRLYIKGCPLISKNNFFIHPFQSAFIDIYVSDGNKNDARNYELDAIEAKMFCLPYEDLFVFIPLVHTL